MASEIKVDTIVNAGGDNDSGIDLSTNDLVKVKTANTERMRVDSSGNISFYENTGTTPKFVFDASTESLSLTTVGTEALDISSTTGAAEIRMGNSNSTFDVRFGAADKASAHADFFVETGGSERMRIESDGDIRVGTGNGSNTVGPSIFGGASDGNFLDLRPEGDGSSASKMFTRVNNTASRTHVIFANPNGNIGSIVTSSSSTAYNTSSDYRLKENVVTDWDATSRLKQLKPSRFNFKSDKDTTVDGFLAHEVSSIVPEAITGEKDAVDADGNPEYQGIDQSKLVPLLVKTIQELEARIATLESK